MTGFLFMRLLNFFFGGKIYISIAAICFYWTGQIILLQDYSIRCNRYALITGLSAYITYTFPKINWQKTAGKWTDRHRLLFIIIGFIDLALIMTLPFYQVIFLLHLATITGLYNYPFRASTKLLPARMIPFLKIIIISYVWASIGSTWAMVSGIHEYSIQVVEVFLLQFLFIFSITIPFDIRDFYIDKEQKVVTIPGIIGIRGAKYMAFITILLFVLMGTYLTNTHHLAFIVIGIIVMGLITGSGKVRNDLYYTGLIDGTIIIYLLALYVVR